MEYVHLPMARRAAGRFARDPDGQVGDTIACEVVRRERCTESVVAFRRRIHDAGVLRQQGTLSEDHVL
jgi:hypothetical protein